MISGSCVLFDLLMHQNDKSDQTVDTTVNNEQGQHTNGEDTPSLSNVGTAQVCVGCIYRTVTLIFIFDI